MSIIITGLKMPTERESFNLTIKYNGTVLDTETGIQVAEAHELPPHGRMIDADALCDGLVSNHPVVIYAKNAPTIIPASEESE